MKKILLLTLIFCWVVFTSSAQELSIRNQKIEWKVDQLLDLRYDSIVSYAASFMTGDGNKILWVQKDGSYTIEFDIVKVRGTWDNPQTDGSISYSVTTLDKKGSIQFTRVSGKTEISCVLMDGDTNIFPFRFQVTNVAEKL